MTGMMGFSFVAFMDRLLDGEQPCGYGGTRRRTRTRARKGKNGRRRAFGFFERASEAADQGAIGVAMGELPSLGDPGEGKDRAL